MKKIIFFLFFIAASFSFHSFGQKQLVDKIAAVVGDKVILQSDVDNSLIDMQRQGVELPPNAACYALEQMMGIKALVLQAEKDSIPVTDEDIDATIDLKIRNAIMQYGSKDELERIAGRTVFQLKEDMRKIFRDQKLAESMRNKIVEKVRITPQEVQAYYNSIPVDSLPFYESELEIGEIKIFPKASHEADNYAIQELKEYKRQIETGGRDMGTIASLYSDDPGARQNAGKYEVNRNQRDFDGVWLSKAFTLKEGQISNPFKTQFGYHIIKLESRSGDDAVVRHILKTPQVTNVELQAAKSKLDTVRSKLITGQIDFGTAVNRYSNDDESKFTAGMRQSAGGGSFLTIDELDKDLIPVLSSLKVGEYSQPMEFTDARGKKGVRIVYLKTKTEPHRENLRDDYNKISARALDEKKMKTLEDWFSNSISAYYLRIDDAYKGCDVLEKWFKAAAAPKYKVYQY